MHLPSGFHDAAKLRILANRIEIRILVQQVQSKTGTQRCGKQVQCFHTIRRMLATIERINAGDLIQVRRTRVAEKRLPGIFVGRLAPAGASQENAPPCPGRDVIGVKRYRPVQDANGIVGTTETFRKHVGLVLQRWR